MSKVYVLQCDNRLDDEYIQTTTRLMKENAERHGFIYELASNVEDLGRKYRPDSVKPVYYAEFQQILEKMDELEDGDEIIAIDTDIILDKEDALVELLNDARKNGKEFAFLSTLMIYHGAVLYVKVNDYSRRFMAEMPRNTPEVIRTEVNEAHELRDEIQFSMAVFYNFLDITSHMEILSGAKYAHPDYTPYDGYVDNRPFWSEKSYFTHYGGPLVKEEMKKRIEREFLNGS